MFLKEHDIASVSAFPVSLNIVDILIVKFAITIP